MAYRSAFTGVGVIGGYLAAALGLSFYIRKRIGARLWRKLHRFTPVAYVMSLVHAIGAGTDASTAWFRTFMLATAAPITVLFVMRLVKSALKTRRPAAKSSSSRAITDPV